jgi:hypothetical protein
MTMTITRDIVTDLLPLYAAGEVSADSRAAVDAMLREDAGLRRLADALAAGTAIGERAEPTPDRLALSRTKKLLRLRASLLGAACFFTGLPWAVAIDDHGWHHWLFRDTPSVGVSSLVAAAGLWTAFLVVSRKLKVTGL